MHQHELLTRKEAAEHLGVHPSTLDRWVKEQILAPVKIGRKYTRFTRSSLAALTTLSTPKSEVPQ